MNVMYFAWVRERIGVPSEDVQTTAATVADLVEELRNREDRYAAAFADVSALRVALDQELSDFDAPLGGRSRSGVFPTNDWRLMTVRVQQCSFDAGAELNAFSQRRRGRRSGQFYRVGARPGRSPCTKWKSSIIQA